MDSNVNAQQDLKELFVICIPTAKRTCARMEADVLRTIMGTNVFVHLDSKVPTAKRR